MQADCLQTRPTLPCSKGQLCRPWQPHKAQRAEAVKCLSLQNTACPANPYDNKLGYYMHLEALLLHCPVNNLHISRAKGRYTLIQPQMGAQN